MPINRQLTSQPDIQIAVRQLDDELTTLKSQIALILKKLGITGPSSGGSSNGSGSGSSNNITFNGDLSGTQSSQKVIGIQGEKISTQIPSEGQFLVWDGTSNEWTPETIDMTFEGDLSGDNTSQTVIGIQNHPVASIAPTNNQILVFNGTSWVPSNQQTIPPSISFSGDLSGNNTKQTVVGIQGFAVANFTPATNQVLTWNGSLWVPKDASVITFSGDIQGTSSLQSVIGLQSHPISSNIPNTNQALIWNGTKWTPTNLPNPNPITFVGDLSGSNTSQTVTGLQNHSVSNTAPTINQILVWNGSTWIPSNQQTIPPATVFSGDISGTSTGPQTIIGLQNHPLNSVAPTTNQILVYDGTKWTASNQQTIPPAVTFGGDLSGSNTSQSVIKIQGQSVSNTAPTTNQVLTWNGSSWIATNLPATAGTTFAGDLSGTSTTQTVVGLRNIPVSATAPTTNQLLNYNGTNWIPTSAINVTGITDSGGANFGSAITVNAGNNQINNNLTVGNQINTKFVEVVDNSTNFTSATAYARFYLQNVSGSLIPSIDTGGTASKTLLIYATGSFQNNNIVIQDPTINTDYLNMYVHDPDSSMPTNSSSIRANAVRPFYIQNLKTTFNTEPTTFVNSTGDTIIMKNATTTLFSIGAPDYIWSYPYLTSNSQFFSFPNTTLITNQSFRCDSTSGYSGGSGTFSIVNGEALITSNSSYVGVRNNNLYIGYGCYATAFNVHASSLSDARLAMLEKRSRVLKSGESEKEIDLTVTIGSWSFIMESDGLKVIAKKSETELYEALIPWTSTYTKEG
jgi:hypothetical protein